MQTSVTVVGNATRDPELRYTASGTPVCSFGVAVTAREKQADGSWGDGEASFYDVTCWKMLAESAAEAIGKGDRVVVTGKLRQSSWETDGQKRSKVEVVADEVGKSILFASLDSGSPKTARPVSNVHSDEPF
jgi:single-strand DNA-binding protein